MIGVRNSDDLEALDAFEVIGIAGVDCEPVCEGRGRDHGVIGPSCRLAADPSKRRRDLAECSCCAGVERQGVEVRFRLLEVRLPCSAYILVHGNQRPN